LGFDCSSLTPGQLKAPLDPFNPIGKFVEGQLLPRIGFIPIGHLTFHKPHVAFEGGHTVLQLGHIICDLIHPAPDMAKVL
jgi:hypothetical protein